jgi:predicted dehydrogenase
MVPTQHKIGFGVIGCGVAAWTGHLPWIWAHPYTELIGVCDVDIARAHDVQRRYSVLQATADYSELLSNPAIEAVCICTPPATHLEIASAAAQRGKHVILEKPMARSVGECERIIASARSGGVRLTVGHEKRFNAAATKIRDIIASGEIGNVFHLTAHWGASVKLAPDMLIPDGFRRNYEWRWTDPDVGGGILQDHLPHYIDLWRWWTGSEVDTVCAEAQHISRDLLGQADLGIWEDFGTVLMRFENGAVASFQTGTAGRALSPIQHLGSGIGEWSEFGYVFGTRGQIVFDFFPWDSCEHGRVMVWSLNDKSPDYRGWYQVELPEPRRALGGPLSPSTNESHMFYRQLDDVVHSLRNGHEACVSGEDGLATLAVVEAVYESVRTSQRVMVKR